MPANEDNHAAALIRKSAMPFADDLVRLPIGNFARTSRTLGKLEALIADVSGLTLAPSRGRCAIHFPGVKAHAFLRDQFPAEHRLKVAA